MPSRRTDERSVPEVIQDIVGNLGAMVRDEIRLAAAEAREEVKHAAEQGMKIGIPLASGVAMSVFASAFLLLACMFALSLVIPFWAACLVIAVVMGLGALVAISIARQQLQMLDVDPERPITKVADNIKGSVLWLKTRSK